MLRIAHLTPAYFSPDSIVGGGERYVDNLSRALALADPGGFEQSIFALGATPACFERDGIPVQVLRNENPGGSFLDGVSGQLWRELRGFDLLHVHQSLTGFGAYCTAMGRALGKTLVLTDLGGGASPLMLHGGGMTLADGVVSISRFAHSLIAPSFRGPHAVLIGPVDDARFAPGPQPRQPRTALCVGRIMRHKGTDRVIRALPPGLRLKIAGVVYDETYYALLRELAEGRDVEFIHDADDDRLLQLYRASSLFIQASTSRDVYGAEVGKPELMGLTTLEAMACGLPVIVSDAGSLPELAPDPRFGRVFASQDALRAMLEQFEQGLWPPAGAGRLARARVETEHGMRAIGRRLAAFYRQSHFGRTTCAS